MTICSFLLFFFVIVLALWELLKLWILVNFAALLMGEVGP
jgi:hypothetical protein